MGQHNLVLDHLFGIIMISEKSINGSESLHVAQSLPLEDLKTTVGSIFKTPSIYYFSLIQNESRTFVGCLPVLPGSSCDFALQQEDRRKLLAQEKSAAIGGLESYYFRRKTLFWVQILGHLCLMSWRYIEQREKESDPRRFVSWSLAVSAVDSGWRVAGESAAGGPEALGADPHVLGGLACRGCKWLWWGFLEAGSYPAKPATRESWEELEWAFCDETWTYTVLCTMYTKDQDGINDLTIHGPRYKVYIMPCGRAQLVFKACAGGNAEMWVVGVFDGPKAWMDAGVGTVGRPHTL